MKKCVSILVLSLVFLVAISTCTGYTQRKNDQLYQDRQIEENPHSGHSNNNHQLYQERKIQEHPDLGHSNNHQELRQERPIQDNRGGGGYSGIVYNEKQIQERQRYRRNPLPYNNLDEKIIARPSNNDQLGQSISNKPSYDNNSLGVHIEHRPSTNQNNDRLGVHIEHRPSTNQNNDSLGERIITSPSQSQFYDERTIQDRRYKKSL